MSLKTTPRGLLAALTVLGVLLLQMPAIMGHTASAASAGAPRTLAPVHHAATARPHTTTSGYTANGVTISHATGPAGVAVLITGSATPPTTTVPVTLTFTDSGGTVTPISTTTSITPTGAYTFNVTLPITVPAGTGFWNVTAGSSAATNLVFSVSARSLSASTTSVTRGTPVVLTMDNYAPGVTITPTLVYSNASTGGISVTQLSPIANVPATGGPFSTTVAIPSNAAYGSTGTYSITATYPVTPALGFPTFTVNAAPTFSVTPTAIGAIGISQTLSLSSTNNGGFNIQPGTTITFVIGLLNQTPSAIAPTAIVTSSATGTFTATLQFTPTVAGTYVITASDTGLNNQATATFQAAVPAAPVATAYLAEGYTGGSGSIGFHTILNMLNPNTVSVIVTDTYLLAQGASGALTTTTGTAPDVVVVTHTIAALSVATVDMAIDIATQPVSSGPDVGHTVSGNNQSVATIIRTAGFTSNPVVRGVAAERLIERLSGNAASPTFSDGDAELATSNPNTSFYFAEGYTGVQFQEYLILLNPSPTVTATVTVNRAPENGSVSLAPLGPYVLAPYQRVTLNIRALNAGAPKAIGLIVNSDHPIVAERTTFYGPGNGSGKPGMSNAQGMTTAAKHLNFAYGSLTGGFDVANPVTGTIVPTSDVQQTIDDRVFITVMNPNIAGQVVAGTTSGTATAPGPSAHVTIQLRGEDGRLLGFFITDVDAGARFTLTNSDLTSGSGGIGFPGVPRSSPTRAGVFSAVVSSSERVVAELNNYFGQGPTTASGDANAGAPGLTLVGAPSGESDVLFPALGTSEVVAGKPLSSTVFLYNPGVNTIQVAGSFFGPGGVVTKQTYTVGPDQIQIVGRHLTDSGGTGSAAGSPMPAGTLGAEFSVVQQRGSLTGVSGEPGQPNEGFVAAAITHSGDASNWWGTQGYYPLPGACSAVTGCP